MQFGNQLEAKSGYMDLQAGIRYHFLPNQRNSDSVLLVVFSMLKSPRTATLITMNRKDFENGLLSKEITPCKEQHTLPQHLWDLEGFNLAKIDKLRGRNKKTSHQDLINKRLAKLAPALEREQEILGSKQPERLLNQIARDQKTNETRFRCEFFTYLAYGKNQYSLLPAVITNGRYDREKSATGGRLGRGSETLGKTYGEALSDKAVQIIEKCYLKFRGRGKHLTDIHEQVMTRGFNAQVVTDEKGKRRFVKRKGGLPVPTLDQFRRCVIKLFGLDTIQKDKYGKERHRRQYATQKGKFSSAVSNLMEQTEEDAYYTEDHPVGIIDKSILPPLAVNTIVDVLSGMGCGIGFSSLKESSEGYDLAQFAAAMYKPKLCSLFDIKIRPEEWPCEGLNLKQKRDRGPGVKREPGSRDPMVNSQVGPVIRKLTPSGQGQSKPHVESSHRRNVRHEGADTVLVSTLTQFEMARREIYKLLQRNQNADMRAHMTQEMIDAGVRPTPQGIWKFYDDRGRNVGQRIAPEDAIRRFLKKIEVTIKPDGVFIGHLRYFSEELKRSGLLSRNGKSKHRESTCKAYVMPICVRVIWVEVNGFLVEVEAQLASRDDKKQLNQTQRSKMAIEAEVRRLLHAPRSDTHPLRHLLFIQTLFGSWDSFWRVYQTVGTEIADAPKGRLPQRGAVKNEKQVNQALRSQLLGLMLEKKWSASRAADEIGVSHQTAIMWATKAGLQTSKRPQQAKDMRGKMVAELRRGCDKNAVATKYGVTVQTITRLLLSEVGLQTGWHAARHNQNRKRAQRIWLAAKRKNPSLGVKGIRLLEPGAYAWLYRNDREWLELHKKPDLLVSPTFRRAVDWSQRDARLSKLALQAILDAREITKENRVTLQQVYQRLPELKAKLGRLDLLPKTQQVLKSVRRQAKGTDDVQSKLGL